MKKTNIKKVKLVSYEEYDKNCSKIIKKYKKLQIDKCLIALLEYACKVKIKEKTHDIKL